MQAKDLWENFPDLNFLLHLINVSMNLHPMAFFLQLEISPLKEKKNQFDYERAHTHSSCYLATNKALLVIAVALLAAKKKKNGQRLFYNHIDFYFYKTSSQTI